MIVEPRHKHICHANLLVERLGVRGGGLEDQQVRNMASKHFVHKTRCSSEPGQEDGGKQGDNQKAVDSSRFEKDR